MTYTITNVRVFDLENAGTALAGSNFTVIPLRNVEYYGGTAEFRGSIGEVRQSKQRTRCSYCERLIIDNEPVCAGCGAPL